MNKIDSLVKDIQALQDYLDYRTEVEHHAIRLMEQGLYDTAMAVLSALDGVSMEDFITND